MDAELDRQERGVGAMGRQVIQEAAELAAANEELKREIEERRLAEARLRQSIEERQWVETQLAGGKELLEMIASGRPLREVLVALCRFVEEASPDSHCGVYAIDWGGPTFQYGVAPSLPPSYLVPIDGLPVRCDTAPCSIAALEKTQVIVPDIETDPRWAGDYRDHVLAHGLRSVWSTPIYSLAGHVLGTFCVYQRNKGTPSQRQLDLIAQVTHIASIAIERAQAEAALKRSEALLAEGQRLSSTGTFSWRPAIGEITWSDQLYRIFEFVRGVRMTTELIRTRVHPDDLASFDKRQKELQGGPDHLEWQYRLRMPDHSIKYVHGVAHAVQTPDGQLEYIAALQDVTERRLSEEALTKLRADLAHVARVSSLGVLTASIAHEVSQPLAGIVINGSTCLRMLSADPPNLEHASEAIRRTIRDANRASEVIGHLRALFGKKKEITKETVDLNEAAREVVTLSRKQLEAGGVEIRSELADDLPVVVGDRVQLQQVILNLLLNAADAMNGVDDRARMMVIRTEREEGDRARLVVQDTGVGIDATNAELPFDAFYTTKEAGMGIGLSVSRSIIEDHDGRIWAAPNDGPGASFAFSIPSRSDPGGFD